MREGSCCKKACFSSQRVIITTSTNSVPLEKIVSSQWLFLAM